MTQEDNYTKGLKKLLEMGREDTMLNQRQISEDMYQLSVGTLFGDIWNWVQASGAFVVALGVIIAQNNKWDYFINNRN